MDCCEGDTGNVGGDIDCCEGDTGNVGGDIDCVVVVGNLGGDIDCVVLVFLQGTRASRTQERTGQ